MLSEPQIERYSRQILVAQVGGIGQEKLLAAQVAIVGGGAAASTAATYLAAAGIGRLLVHEALVDVVAGINDDCVVRCLSLPVSVDVLAEIVDHSAAVISVQTDAIAVSTLYRLCVAAQRILLWGSDRGGWATLNRAQDRAPSLCVACVIEAAGTEESPTAAFWVGSQLAAAAMSMIIGCCPAPGEMYSFAALVGVGAPTMKPSREPCRHGRMIRATVANADRNRS